MHNCWNWPTGSIGTGSFYDTLVSGLFYSLTIAIMSWLPALLLGVMLARLCGNRLEIIRTAGRLYVNLACEIPLFVQIFVWCFANRSILSAILCITGYSAARIARQLILTAGTCKPAASILISESAVIFQASCVVLTIGVVDQLAATDSLNQLSIPTLESCSAALLIYLLTRTLTSAAVSHLRTRSATLR